MEGLFQAYSEEILPIKSIHSFLLSWVIPQEKHLEIKQILTKNLCFISE